MGEHTTWFDLLPGYQNLVALLQPYMSRTVAVEAFPTTFTLVHVCAVLLVFLFVAYGALCFRAATEKGDEQAIVPSSRLGMRAIFELFTEAVLGLMSGIMGPKNAARFLPLIGTLAFFIFLCNMLTLIPGFIPPTSMLKTNVALAVTVFLVTHIWGVKEHGLSYFKHFFGPHIDAPWYVKPATWLLALLMFVIELISHFARPLSLSLRLMGNMFADHKVVFTFFTLVPILVPVPFLVLGTLVCVVQTLVFCLLSTVYISMAVAEAEGHAAEGEHGHGAAAAKH
jgi:F-type H+-transporting ATPase subunit a